MSEVRIDQEHCTFEEVFPALDCDVEPLGNRIVVQLRKAKTKTKGGIVLPSETRATEKYNEVIALVKKIGPLAYRSPKDLMPWPEGAWCVEGDLVRTIKWGGDRWSVRHEDDWVHFIIVNDSEIIARLPNFAAAQRQYAFVE